jgi:hypothetical protein
MMKHGILLLASSIFAASSTWGQTALELREVAVIPVVPNQTTRSFLEPIKCSSDSTIYFQITRNEKNPFLNPVARVSPDGKAFIFPLPQSIRSGEAQEIADFAPKPGGGVAILLTGASGKEHYISMFDALGRETSNISLPQDIKPLQIAVAPPGKILLSGWVAGPTASGQPPEAFAGLYDERGQPVVRIPLNNDIEPAPLDAPEFSYYRAAIALSSAQASDKDLFLLTRLQTTDGPVHIISAENPRLANTFRALVQDGTVVSSAKADGNTVAVMSIRKKPASTQNEIADVYISLWDAATGTKLGEFHHSSPHLGSAFACYKAGTFTFLTTGANSEMQLVKAVGSQ